MAILRNLQEGAAALAVELEILGVEPRQGMLARGRVSMNSDAGLAWVQVRFQLGGQTFFEHQVLLYSADLLAFCAKAEAMLAAEGRNIARSSRAGLSRASPELGLQLHQRIWQTTGLAPRVEGLLNQVTYSLQAVVDTAIAAGGRPTGKGPALLLDAQGEEVRQFIHDLHSETQIALLLT